MMYWINGEFLTQQNASISARDLGLTRGFGVFDYLRTYGRRPFHLFDHVERLRYGAQEIGLKIPYKIEPIIEELIKTSDAEELSLRLILTGGVSEDQLLPQEKPSLIIQCYPFTAPPKEQYQEGIRAKTLREMRSLAHIKTTHYLPAIVALKQAKCEGINEVLYRNSKQELLEGATSNLFFIQGNQLITAAGSEILSGITREVVLRLTKPIYQQQLKSISLQEALQCEEAFITSSNREIMPLVAIDAQAIGNGMVGPKTLQLMALFTDYTRKGPWQALHIAQHLVFP